MSATDLNSGGPRSREYVVLTESLALPEHRDALACVQGYGVPGHGG